VIISSNFGLFFFRINFLLKKKKIREEKEIPKDEQSNSNDEEPTKFDFRKAKFDVFKFGIKGFSKEEQENANVQLAIKLGATVIFFFPPFLYRLIKLFF